MTDLHKSSKKKYLLQCHLIFVTKYRRDILDYLKKDLFNILRNIESKSNFTIKNMEIDKNHIHFLIDYEPKISITSIVRRLKQISTYKIWKIHKDFLYSFYWKERTLWSDGYFVASIGNACEKTIRDYILNQG